MPCKNALKEYEPGGYYHLYNRGVNKDLIFQTDKDYKTFLSFLKLYLSPPPTLSATLQGDSLQAHKIHTAPSKQLKNYAGEITLLAYCLMPNHFHLMVKQNTDYGIEYFMRSLITKYVRYYNSHYQRIGHLFQGTYKAVRIENEYQFTYLTKYIHRNPLDLPPCKETPCRLIEYTYSSLPNYLGHIHQDWLHPKEVFALFSTDNPSLTYQSFIKESEPDDITILSSCTLDIEDD